MPKITPKGKCFFYQLTGNCIDDDCELEHLVVKETKKKLKLGNKSFKPPAGGKIGLKKGSNAFKLGSDASKTSKKSLMDDLSKPTPPPANNLMGNLNVPTQPTTTSFYQPNGFYVSPNGGFPSKTQFSASQSQYPQMQQMMNQQNIMAQMSPQQGMMDSQTLLMNQQMLNMSMGGSGWGGFYGIPMDELDEMAMDEMAMVELDEMAMDEFDEMAMDEFEQMQQDEPPVDEDYFDENYKDCECCHGYIYKCEGEICNHLGVCHCVARDAIEVGGQELAVMG